MAVRWRACESVLLIGAGFSKDFGGLLAREMWDELFRNSRVRGFPELLRQLDDFCPDYETVYERVVLTDPDSPEASALRTAVVAAYDTLDARLRDPMGPVKALDTSRVGALINLFAPKSNRAATGFVFSLNQDLLPERYAWNRAHFGFPALPGFGPLPGRAGPYLQNGDGAALSTEDIRRAPTQETIDREEERWLVPGNLYWLKLHGSHNWRDSEGRDLMVIGGGKDAQIQREPILRWYWEVFRRALTDGRHRLVVIGYSFRDSHVNAVIAAAVETAGLELVVLDSAPWNKFRQARSSDQGWVSIARRIAYSRESCYYSTGLIDIFPYASYGDTDQWKELRERLRLPLPAEQVPG